MTTKTSITVRYAETDQMGIAHHANYAVWYEVARTEFVKQLGATYTEIEQHGCMLPVVELTSRYISVARYEDELTVETTIKTLLPSRIEFSYKIFGADPYRPINTGSTLHAWVDAKTFQPINLKKHLPELYDRLEQCLRPM